MEMSMCLQIYLTCLTLRQEKRNQEYLQLRKEDAHRTENSAEDAILMVTLKALLMAVGFFCVTATIRLHLFFCFPLFLLSPGTAVKISFAELFQQTIPNSPPLQELRCCHGVTTSVVLDGKYSCWAFVFSFTTQEQIHCGPTISHFKEDFSKCVDLFGPDEKEKLQMRRKMRTVTTIKTSSIYEIILFKYRNTDYW